MDVNVLGGEARFFTQHHHGFAEDAVLTALRLTTPTEQWNPP